MLWGLTLALGVAALVAAVFDYSPIAWLTRDRLAVGGGILVCTAFTWALSFRTGGRPVVFGGLALALGLAVVWTDLGWLRTGASVMTVVISAVLAVMVTVPAVRFLDAAREVVIAMGISCIGAFAALGFAPVISAERFRYATLGLALIIAFLLVYRLGAGLHGLGRRGLALVLVGSVVLAFSLAYAELLRRYGSPGAVESVYDAAHWVWRVAGALPRPIIALLGVPALAWGAHMRARRRQGWWITAFGVAATATPGYLLVRHGVPLAELGLQVLYSLALGLIIGFLVIRLDLWLSDTRGSGARRSEEKTAIRPEPKRHHALS